MPAANRQAEIALVEYVSDLIDNNVQHGSLTAEGTKDADNYKTFLAKHCKKSHYMVQVRLLKRNYSSLI